MVAILAAEGAVVSNGRPNLIVLAVPMGGRGEFFKELTEHGSYFGYSVNSPKYQLILKEVSKNKALRLFDGTAVEIVESCRVLGSIIGNEKSL